MAKHTPVVHTNCREERHCLVCDGLFICSVCGGAEGALTTECPGERLSYDDLERVYAEKIDFKDGRWTGEAPLPKPRAEDQEAGTMNRRSNERQRRIEAAVADALGDKVICHCGATLATFSDVCTAYLTERCAGFKAIDAARKEARCRPAAKVTRR